MSHPASVVIDAIVLAFSRSKLRDIVGTDALKMVLGGTTTSRELMPRPNTLSLQPLWELLETQPGFVAEDAVPPLCRIKGWETSLEMAVEMPTHLAAVSALDCEHHAVECEVSEEELANILAPPPPPPPPPAPPPRTTAPRAAEAVALASSTSLQVHPGSSRRTVIAVVLAVLGIVAVIVSIKLTFGGDSRSTKLAASEISKEIPLVQVQQSGPVIGAVLADRSWLTKPEPERRRQLAAALDNAKALGANDLVLNDSKGRLVASAAARAGKTIVTFAKR